MNRIKEQCLLLNHGNISFILELLLLEKFQAQNPGRALLQ